MKLVCEKFLIKFYGETSMGSLKQNFTKQKFGLTGITECPKSEKFS
ncbi:hypothetical protein OMAG_002748 [Candidatus Omnitrophus magneticus]|uniref:Uncharacterized protein n=1 Tax=Candidatus Omnitrophus magneticus TaxID=1609969 RepID=A0A0F0CJH9_9BACT|nr:hypothetical protein OMAG_002748 [Candidatus Omnitrophus magneticus]